MSEAPDEEVLAAARSAGAVLISSDTDFGELLARSNAAEPSVILLRRQEGRRASEVPWKMISELAPSSYSTTIASEFEHSRFDPRTSQQPAHIEALSIGEDVRENGTHFSRPEVPLSCVPRVSVGHRPTTPARGRRFPIGSACATWQFLRSRRRSFWAA
jgi:hypothetical protein